MSPVVTCLSLFLFNGWYHGSRLVLIFFGLIKSITPTTPMTPKMISIAGLVKSIYPITPMIPNMIKIGWVMVMRDNSLFIEG